MRIAVFIKKTTFHKGYGGLETQNKILCEGLVKQGYEVSVFSPQYELTEDKKTEGSVDYYFVKSIYKTLFSEFIKNHWYNKSYKYFIKLHNKLPYDLIISQSSAGLGVMKHKKQIGVPILTVSHGSALMEYKTLLNNIYGIKDLLFVIKNTPYVLYNLIIKQRFFIKNSDKVIAVSNYVSKSLQNETASNKNKFVVINNAIEYLQKIDQSDIEKNIAKKINSQVKNILYLGQIQKSKGIDNLIEIAKDDRLKNININVVGGGDYLEQFKQKVVELGLQSKFTIHGKVEYSNVKEFYDDAFVFVFPTKRYEGFPMVLVEAMFTYLPIISFNMGGVGDAIDDKTTGYIIENNNNKQLCDKIYNLISDNNLYLNMCKKSYNKAVQEFEISTMLEKYLIEIRNLIDENM